MTNRMMRKVANMAYEATPTRIESSKLMGSKRVTASKSAQDYKLTQKRYSEDSESHVALKSGADISELSQQYMQYKQRISSALEKQLLLINQSALDFVQSRAPSQQEDNVSPKTLLPDFLSTKPSDFTPTSRSPFSGDGPSFNFSEPQVNNFIQNQSVRKASHSHPSSRVQHRQTIPQSPTFNRNSPQQLSVESVLYVEYSPPHESLKPAVLSEKSNCLSDMSSAKPQSSRSATSPEFSHAWQPTENLSPIDDGQDETPMTPQPHRPQLLSTLDSFRPRLVRTSQLCETAFSCQDACGKPDVRGYSAPQFHQVLPSVQQPSLNLLPHSAKAGLRHYRNLSFSKSSSPSPDVSPAETHSTQPNAREDDALSPAPNHRSFPYHPDPVLQMLVSECSDNHHFQVSDESPKFLSSPKRDKSIQCQLMTVSDRKLLLGAHSLCVETLPSKSCDSDSPLFKCSRSPAMKCCEHASSSDHEPLDDPSIYASFTRLFGILVCFFDSASFFLRTHPNAFIFPTCLGGCLVLACGVIVCSLEFSDYSVREPFLV